MPHKDPIARKEYLKQYAKKNKEKKRDYDKEYNEKNKEMRAKHYAENKDEVNRISREWYEKNKEYRKEYKKKYTNNLRSTDPRVKLKHNISCLLRQSLKKKGYSKKSRTYDILCCSFEELKLHLENQFESWMNWDNYGKYQKDTFNFGWDIDHIIPVSSALNEEDIIMLNHYINLQPLCSKFNRDLKKDKINNI
jgi:hypothetical protein